ncbi:MAG: alpha/beta hydrolase, partial [Rubrivivax sp.]
METRVYYATNRGHEGPERFQPTGYGKNFSSDGMENLRFGRVSFEADDAEVQRLLAQQRAHTGIGDGEALQDYFAACVGNSQRIQAYAENIPEAGVSEKAQADAKLGSAAMFDDLQRDMAEGRDMLVFIHGYNVSWAEAVGSAAALEAMLNHPGAGGAGPLQPVRVVLFTWPSNGQALPFVSYKSDRSDAVASGGAVGRALLKTRDFLHALGRERRKEAGDVKRERDRLAALGLRDSELDRMVAQYEATQLCGQKLHLLAHSMGSFVLQNALGRIWDNSPGSSLPRLFDQVFLCAADVDDDVLEAGQPMERLHQLSNRVWVYHNANDRALTVSDYTKGNPDRLGQRGAARPQQLHQKVAQVDCSALVTGLTQHSYYANGRVNRDIRLALQGMEPGAALRALKSGDMPG